MKIVCVSDLHVGSTVGLMPPEAPVGKEGNIVQASPAQRWLWECWEAATGWSWERQEWAGGWLDEVLGDGPYTLVVLGDAIEGRHHGTTELVSHDIEEHRMLAEEILHPLASAAETTYVVRGTECHARTIESSLGKTIGAKRCPATRDHCWEDLFLKPAGILTHFQHHVSTSTNPWTASGGFSKALIAEQANAVGFGHTPPRVIVRAHRHRFGCFKDQNGLIVCLPPWQLLTRFARKVTQQHLACPGLVVLDYDNLDDDNLPRVRHRIFRPSE